MIRAPFVVALGLWLPGLALAAGVEVAVLPGAGSPGAAGAPAPDVHLVLDLSESMTTPLEPGVTRLDVARATATRFLGALPPETPITLHTLGIVAGSKCPAAAPAGFPSAEAAAGFARSAMPRSEGSLAGTLDALAVAQRGRAGLARVVVVSDLAADCGGDLCGAAGRLLDANATLDFVVVGGAAPACLSDGADLSEPVRQAEPAAGAIRFHVSRVDAAGALTRVASGESGPGVVDVAAGEVWVDVELSPGLRVGPLTLPAEGVRRIEVVDFPAATPPLREVYVDGVREALVGVEALP